MKSFLFELTEKCAVSGCENEIRGFLSEHLKKNGLTEQSILSDCLLVEKKGKGEKKVCVFVPMDLPGFLALYTEPSKASLVPTAKFPFAVNDGFEIYDEDHALHVIKKPNEKEDVWFLEKENVALGDVFWLSTHLEEKENELCGYFAANFALMDLVVNELIQRQSVDAERDYTFVFTASTQTRASRERLVSTEFEPAFCLHLGMHKDEKSFPALVIRDGKQFSDQREVERIKRLAEENEIKINLLVTSEPITKAEAQNSFNGIPTISLSLPYETSEEGKEIVKLSAIHEFKKLLNLYLSK